MREGFLVDSSFFDKSVVDQLFKPVANLLFLLEMEGKFTIRRPRNPTEKLKRVDKYLEYSLSHLDNNQEMKELR